MNSNLRKLIEDILILTLDGEFTSESMNLALNKIKLENIEYTGSGCFIKFKNKSNHYKLDLLNKNYNQNDFRFDGIELKNDLMNLLCDINVYIIDLKIDHIEIWNKLGTEMDEIPSRYILNQKWKAENNKSLERL